MNRHISSLTVAAALAVGSPLAFAQAQQEPATPFDRQVPAQQEPELRDTPAPAAGARAEMGESPLSKIESFIGEDTAAILHVDLSQADLARVQQFFTGVVGGADIPEAQMQQMATQLGGVLAMAQTWGQRLTDAGAQNLFVVTRLHENKPQVAVIVPAEQGQQDQIKQLLTPPAGDEAAQNEMMGAQPRTEVIRDAVVLGSADAIQQFQQPATGHAESFEAALEAVSDASAQILVQPSRELQQAMQQQGGGQIPLNPAGQVDFDQAVEWMAVGIDYPQQAQILKVVMETTDEAKAKELADGLKNQIAQLQQQGQQPGQAQLAGQELQALEPEVEGNRVTISLDKEEAAKLLRQGLKAAPAGMQPGRQQQGQQGQQ